MLAESLLRFPTYGSGKLGLYQNSRQEDEQASQGVAPAAAAGPDQALHGVQPDRHETEVTFPGGQIPAGTGKQLTPLPRIAVALEVLADAHAVGVLRELGAVAGFHIRRNPSGREEDLARKPNALGRRRPACAS